MGIKTKEFPSKEEFRILTLLNFIVIRYWDIGQSALENVGGLDAVVEPEN